MNTILAITSVFSVGQEHPLSDVYRLVDGYLGEGNIASRTPHLTWQFADDYKIGYLKELEKICKTINLTPLFINGLGLFSSENPVLYLNIVHTMALDNIHRMVWNKMQRYAENPSPLYAPDQWIPHITLSYNYLDEFKLGGLIIKLLTIDLTFSILIDNVTVLNQDNNGGVCDTCHFPL